MTQPAQLFEMRISAIGEVRDSDGNLISAEPIESTVVVTAEQAAEILGLTNEGDPS